MKCWHCEDTARAVCVFCGRGVCASHRKAKPCFEGYYGLKKKSFFSGVIDASQTTTQVKDASWCGVCQVEDFVEPS